ncbi:DsbA family protein [Pelorhabdus rhamnosifermentans]|uniref:DsbA family protein n=1 Tax=Pelorhabdus rhamnosifermentans TaxID=2772457 RepID=UPI001C05EE66|nr:thioredoxin domain-containing protein [Pelorhabdus rhamnosifermentans]
MTINGTPGWTAPAVYGNPFASVTITEYADFQCSYCSEAQNVVDQVLNKGQVNLALKHLPLECHTDALPAAKCFEVLYRRNPAVAWSFYKLAFTEQSFLKGGNALYLIIS